MNKKSLLGLILFAGLVIACLFAGTNFLIHQGSGINTKNDQVSVTEEKITKAANNGLTEPEAGTGKETQAVGSEGNTNTQTADATETLPQDDSSDTATAGTSSDASAGNLEEPWLSSNPSDTGNVAGSSPQGVDPAKSADNSDDKSTDETFSTSLGTAQAPKLIYDSDKVDYKAYIPDMVIDSQLKSALDFKNPSIGIDATSAILFDADTKEVLYYKNAVQAMFPASTAKLLTSLTALNWCKEDDQVTIGDEITMIASDSTRAFLKEGQVLTVRNILNGMLLPSGNDAAYALAAYVGKKSLQNPKATKEEAIAEFVRLMNLEAKQLGVKNSCFKTPDGYDAIGQYTTAYDMGLIGVAASKNALIIDVSKKSSARNVFPSGEDVTWNNTNKLITKYSGQYYSHAIGLKTGTSTMAGRCLIAAAKEDDRTVVCVIMDSSSAGRWEDAIALLKYGLEN